MLDLQWMAMDFLAKMQVKLWMKAIMEAPKSILLKLLSQTIGAKMPLSTNQQPPKEL